MKNINDFISEINNAEFIMIIAIGKKTKKILDQSFDYLKDKIKIKGDTIYEITHYSAAISKENLRNQIIELEKFI